MKYPSPPRKGPRGFVAVAVFVGTLALTGVAVVYLLTTGWVLLVLLWDWALG